mmetsp:Transcript_98712/g.247358  ORF Transcript_98712/g.247358 Transcript_98712/m.247358 type:complete len:225 (+) Transcript_98712:854-1528(+)
MLQSRRKSGRRGPSLLASRPPAQTAPWVRHFDWSESCRRFPLDQRQCCHGDCWTSTAAESTCGCQELCCAPTAVLIQSRYWEDYCASFAAGPPLCASWNKPRSPPRQTLNALISAPTIMVRLSPHRLPALLHPRCHLRLTSRSGCYLSERTVAREAIVRGRCLCLPPSKWEPSVPKLTPASAAPPIPSMIECRRCLSGDAPTTEKEPRKTLLHNGSGVAGIDEQ